MKNNNHCSLVHLFLAAVFASSIATSANAATWHIQSLTDNSVYGNSTTTGFYDFTDGLFTTEQTVSYQGTNYSDRQWLTKASGSAPDNIIDGYFFAGYVGTAPSVNTANRTINLSGLYWLGLTPVANTGTGYNEGWIYKDYMGWALQPARLECAVGSRNGCLYYDWFTYSNVPYTVNSNGTFTANWTAHELLMGSTHTLSMTFHDAAFVPAAVVPVPSALWLMGSGLMGLLGLIRRKTV